MTPITTRQRTSLALLAALSFAVACSSQLAAAKDSSSPEELLLKDYRPKSIYKIPRTVVEKANTP